MIYDQLDANKIPRGTVGDDVPLEALDSAVASLICLGVTLPIWLNCKDLSEQLHKGLCAHWPDIRRWVLFLYRDVIIQEDIDIDMRYTCKTAVLEFLGLVRDRLLMSWSKSIPTDREIMKMICDLWFIETRDPRFSSWSPGANSQRESAVFNSCFLIAHEVGTSIDWGNLLSLFQGEPEVIATVSLCHLDREISHRNELDLSCIAWDLHIITVLSLRENIRLALMRQGTIKAASEILALVVDREWKGDMRVLATRCMINAIVLLRSRIEEMDALPFLTQALERGLVASLLKCEVLLAFTEQPLAPREPIILLGDILPGYSVYRSILHQLALAVDLAIAQKLDTKLFKGGELYKAWKRLKDIVDQRRVLVRRDLANGHIQTCQNDMCSKASRMGRFKRCGGCLHAYYCSRKCQRYDWHNGKHKQYCMRIRQRFIRTNGQMSTVHSKDLKFLDQVILAELRKHHERLSTHPSKLTLVDVNLVGGHLNVVFDARGTNANPFGTKCGCEIFANTRWKRMAEVVREGKRPMVLVRAFISGGMSRKIVLQAIPLGVVLEGQRRKSQAVEKYQFNLIFTCCGSEGNDSKGPRI
ncbi:hypothetical protein JVT61DRAFT_864 [Boletus reticuloceps]|uniref:MYND-type domain-containing protein n=1 Tax=Boletus reticuloceps TaxID=495285 RepID=A0A8I2YS34_9AGAM|nr:hypothetical protein JVT61DRAFT_864 [Boletus reticuloceps]